jgi:hypothetical protein
MLYSDDRDGEALDTAEAASILEYVCSLYEQGVPFFTKHAFREIVRQVDLCRANLPTPPAEVHDDDPDADHEWPFISIPAIDGTVIDRPLTIGCVKPGDSRDTEFVL